jgi:hypothetical protein
MLKNLKESQSLYIKNYIKHNPVCKIKNLVEDISTINSKEIKNINFQNPHDMNALVCLYNSIFLSSCISKNEKDGILQLINITKWVNKTEHIKIESVNGIVYILNILKDIKVIIKFSDDDSKESYDDILYEYFIGIYEINKLRYIVPNFVYTFGIFKCNIDKNQKFCTSKDGNKYPFILMEYVEGDNIRKLLKNNLQFSEYLGIFIQLLIALEVAQRTIDFTHFDLHTNNVMCKPLKTNVHYDVPLDDLLYKVSSIKYLPVCIDFGMSTVKHDKKILYLHVDAHRINCMIQGIDMYNFLCESLFFAEDKKLKKEILNLFSFYGNDDTYKLIESNGENINVALEEYVEKAYYSKIAVKTPLEFLQWILNNPNYKNISSKYIKIEERKIFKCLTFSSSDYTYSKLVSKPFNYDSIYTLIKNCIKYENSYIFNKYNIFLIQGLLKSVGLDKDKYKENVGDENSFIENDKKMLVAYESIPIPNVENIKKYSEFILNIRIDSSFVKNPEYLIKVIRSYSESIIFLKELKPYLQFLYNINELNLNKTYESFIYKFKASSIYKIYIENKDIIIKTKRWMDTLLHKIRLI